jgi:hypothetical protein
VAHLLRKVARALRELAELLERGAPGKPVWFLAGWSQPLGEEFDMGEVTATVGDRPKRASAVFLDASGAPTTPDEVPVWSSSDEAVAPVVAAEDGLSALVSFVGEGSAIIELHTTETDDAGAATDISGTGLVTVRSADASPDAVSVSIEFSDEPEA